MKKYHEWGTNEDWFLPKFIRIMKLTVMLLIFFTMQVTATVYSQITKITINMQNVSIIEVLQKIESQTDFRFIYENEKIKLDKKINIDVKEKNVESILDQIFDNEKINYTITKNNLILINPLKSVSNSQTNVEGNSAQLQKTIKGKVTDQSGLPIPGASIIVKGTTIGITTDNNGNYSLINIPENATLQFSFVGMKSQEVKVGTQTTISVVLMEESIGVEEVVVVGYGTSRKKDLTGAVSTISQNDLTQGAITNPLQQIAGKATGVSISQSGSEPGTAPTVRIRGITSLIGGNDPLIVVDGIQGNMDLLNQVPSSEIESIDILKDASSTAIYGSRGAPGVLIVTTKKNKEGRTSVEYNAVTSIDVIGKTLRVLNADEWREQAKIYGVSASSDHGANTDWFKQLTRMGTTQNHTLSFGGSTNKLNYRASITAILQNGTVIKSDYKKYIGKIQVTQKALEDKLTLTMNLNNAIINASGSPQSIGRASFRSNLISNSYVSKPTDPIFNPDGTYFTDLNVFQYLNPYATAQTVVNESQVNNLYGNLRADLEISKGMTLGWFGNWRKTESNLGYYLPAKSTDATAIEKKGIANVNNNRQVEKLMDISLNYKKDFGKHNIDAIVVYEWQNQILQGNFVQTKGFANDIATFNSLQSGDISKVQPGDFSSYKNERKLISFLGRINYSFLSRYLLTVSMRRDGSSVFGPNHKWGNFPSTSVAWRIDQEPFMAKQNIFNNLKLRAGYGVTGNQQGLYPQSSPQLVGPSGITYFNGATTTNFVITQNANADLRWETRNQTNIGVDFSMFDSRLSGTLDLYTASTKNLLFNYTVPQPPYPYNTIVANVGSLLNEGLEISLGYQLLKSKNTTLTLAGNISLLRNKVLNLNGSINGVPLNTDYVPWGSSSYLIAGKPIGTFNILKHEGKNNANEETVVDRNKDNIIDTGNRSEDRFLEGSALPTYTFAFTPSFTHKNFDVSMVWRGSGGNKIMNGLRSSLSYLEILGRSNVVKSAVPLGIYTSQYQSDLWLEDGAFLRFDNLTIGYRINISNLKYISGIRLSLTGNNIALMTKYSGIDPELNFTGGNGFGSDGGIYPRTRSFAIGLDVSFK